MFKISVIIPTYNDELYLENCIQSIINQTLSFKENIQMILVDDSSKDSSHKIAKAYEEKYPGNIITAKTEKNSGAGGRPRNIGIELATGKYLMFSDADDFFSEDAFEKMYNEIEKKNADFIISNWIYAEEDGTPWKEPVFDAKRFEEFKLSIEDREKSFWVMNSSMCNKIFNRDFINKNKIRCLEGMSGEDTYFAMHAFLEAKNVYYIKDITYYYRQRNKTAKTASTSWKCSKEFFEGMSKAYKELFDLFVKYEKLDFYRFIYARNLTYLLYRVIDSEQSSDEEKVEIFKELKWFLVLSKTLNVKTVQNFLTILINKIEEDKFKEAVEICNIIGELRKYLETDVKSKMSKPHKEMYDYILKNPLKK